MSSWHNERHYTERNNWLRAAVLGANDGLISVGSLLIGMINASPDQSTLLIAGIAALFAGAVSMAAGEYVSVSSQLDTEIADMHQEAEHLKNYPEKELAELTLIYEGRGLSQKLARQVAVELTEHDALTTHMRDEIGISETVSTNPIQAALASATSFILGATLPLLIAILAPYHYRMPTIFSATLIGLMLLGYVSAKLGGARIIPAILRIFILGVFALAITGIIGHFVGTIA